MPSGRVRIDWWRSFYWRIATGFVLCLIGVVAAQPIALFWLIDRSNVADEPAVRQAMQDVARDLSAALSTEPALDLPAYVGRRYPRPDRPFIVLMYDGRVAGAGGAVPPVPQVARRRRFGPSAVSPLAPGRGIRRVALTPLFGEITLHGQPVGVVMPSPPGRAWLGRATTSISLVLVLAGTTLAALIIFRPLRRRMQELEEAARKVGDGHTGVRAPVRGRDEWTALARTFNRMAADLQARAEQVKAAERTRRVLLADVSHELRTPLTTMSGYLDTLLSANADLDAPTAQRYVEIVREETRQLERIVGDLLDLARIEAAGDSLDVQDVSLEDLFGRAVARAGLEAQARRVQVSTEIAPGAEIVTGDVWRLEQALQNLIGNALRHTPAGGRIELAAVGSPDGIRISVRDTGSGIPPEHLPFVFDRFYKVDASRPHVSTGSGLGLSIVKAIIERHGGSISVESRLGSGTTFTMHLPDVDSTSVTE